MEEIKLSEKLLKALQDYADKNDYTISHVIEKSFSTLLSIENDSDVSDYRTRHYSSFMKEEYGKPVIQTDLIEALNKGWYNYDPEETAVFRTFLKDPGLDDNFIPQNIDESIIPKEVYEIGYWRDYWGDIAEFRIFIDNLYETIEYVAFLENYIKLLESWRH